MRILTVNCTINESKTFRLATTVHTEIITHNESATFASLSKTPIPICNGSDSFSNHHVQTLHTMIQQASGIVLASPIYNYSINSGLKSLIEHCGQAFQKKPIGFLCTAGAEKSYMSLLPTMTSMMLDFRCIIYPRFVYVSAASFAPDGSIIHSESVDRIKAFATEFTQFTHRLTMPL